jgi:hypothetical protein
MNFHTRKWVKPEDLNPNGTLFGGSLLRWIDEEAAIYAISQLDNQRVVTKFMSEINFVSSARQGDIIEHAFWPHVDHAALRSAQQDHAQEHSDGRENGVRQSRRKRRSSAARPHAYPLCGRAVRSLSRELQAGASNCASRGGRGRSGCGAQRGREPTLSGQLRSR